MQEYLNMFRYIVFSFLIADLIFNVEGCASIASFVDFVSDPITPETYVGGNVYHQSSVSTWGRMFNGSTKERQLEFYLLQPLC